MMKKVFLASSGAVLVAGGATTVGIVCSKQTDPTLDLKVNSVAKAKEQQAKMQE
jgi:hypothetical protein